VLHFLLELVKRDSGQFPSMGYILKGYLGWSILADWVLVGILCLALWSTAHSTGRPWEKHNDAGEKAYEQGSLRRG